DNTDVVDNTDNTDVVDNTDNTDVVDNTDNTTDVNNVVKSGNVVSEILNYSIEPVSKYSVAHPIPMNEPLPGGIVFKVQIGAFKSAIKPDAFGGLNPVTGEILAGSAYTRYLVGLFKTYEGATIVKDEVKTMGYRDAFIVAYKDGKRIQLYEARNIIKDAGVSEKESYNALAKAEVDAIKNRVSSSALADNNRVVENTSNSDQSNTSNIPKESIVTGTDLNKVNGLLYTVQIGVYKQPITHDKLYNLKPIYEEKTQYGFTRYTTGIFNDYNIADAEKDRIVKLGIGDAFVTAYFNGKRLSVGEAKNIEKSNGSDIFANTESVKMTEQPVNNTSTDLGDTKNIEIVFKVQIGAYKEQVPTSVVGDFIKVASTQGLDQYKDVNGITIYSVGNFKSYDQATQMKSVLINDGIKDAFVVSYNGKQKIPINEALRLLGQ
ncbi:MAG: SPOR domain-containing protein, partial [Bacteroidota bacterium]